MQRNGPVCTNTIQITYLHEYFLTNAEIEVLERSADSIANAIPSGAMIMELGSGFVTVSGCRCLELTEL